MAENIIKLDSFFYKSGKLTGRISEILQIELFFFQTKMNNVLLPQTITLEARF